MRHLCDRDCCVEQKCLRGFDSHATDESAETHPAGLNDDVPRAVRTQSQVRRKPLEIDRLVIVIGDEASDQDRARKIVLLHVEVEVDNRTPESCTELPQSLPESFDGAIIETDKPVMIGRRADRTRFCNKVECPDGAHVGLTGEQHEDQSPVIEHWLSQFDEARVATMRASVSPLGSGLAKLVHLEPDAATPVWSGLDRPASSRRVLEAGHRHVRPQRMRQIVHRHGQSG